VRRTRDNLLARYHAAQALNSVPATYIILAAGGSLIAAAAVMHALLGVASIVLGAAAGTCMIGQVIAWIVNAGKGFSWASQGVRRPFPRWLAFPIIRQPRP
jgi:hypothetical protein